MQAWQKKRLKEKSRMLFGINVSSSTFPLRTHWFIILSTRTSHSPSTPRSEKQQDSWHTFWCRRRFDTDNSGYLDEDELMKAFLVMGMRLESEELKVIMNEYDMDGSGQIDLDEFEGMIRLG